jgi:hypothetical protein
MSDWPQTGDSFLAASPDCEADALFVNSGDWFISYALSYKTAADSVVESVEANRLSPDMVGYAVFSLYRHYLEVMLKGLIKIGNTLHERNSDYPNDEHRLSPLWQKCRPLLEKSGSDWTKAELDAVEKCLSELHDLDPRGQAGRYGEYSDGTPTFPERVQLSLTNLRDVMNKIGSFLEGSYDWLDELSQYQADVDSESI